MDGTVILLNPHGTNHALEAYQGQWHGWDNLAMGFERKQGVIEDVLTALNEGRELSHGFKELKDA